MDFLKRHLFYLVCGLIAALGLALMITGVQAMPKVVDEMNKMEGTYRALTGLRSKPANRAQIEAAQRRIDAIVDDSKQVFDLAKTLYHYELLIPDVLPNGDALKRGEFRKKYNEAMQALFDSLHAGGTANRIDLVRASELVERELAEEVEAQRNPAFKPSRVIPEGPLETPAGVLTDAGAHRRDLPRANIAAAQRILMYATHWLEEKPPTVVSSLDFSSAMSDTGSVDAPEAWEVWQAQIGYWIQRDVINAINSINQKAAKEARKRGEHAWVGNMPVKELISIRLSSGLVPLSGEVVVGPKAGGYDASLPPGTPETVFTHSGSDDLRDVIQYSVKMVMDQRDIPKLVDGLVKNSFHTLLRISYEEVPVNRRMIGKIYGPEPAVNVIMDFETNLLGEVFRRTMPPSVIEDYDVQCREGDECASEGS